jgi:hypothetical protein
MKLIDKAKAVLAWAWGWIVSAWNWVKAAGNQVIDPPPEKVKYYLVIVLAIAVGGALFGGSIVSWFDRSVLGPLHIAFYPVAQPVEPTLLLPKGAIIPSAMPAKDEPKAELPPLKPVVAAKPVADSKKAPVAPPAVRAYRAKPKAKSASSPFPG